MELLISDFCKRPTKQKFNKLPQNVRDIFSQLSKETLHKNPGHMLSHRILAYYQNQTRPLGFVLPQYLWRIPAISSPKDYKYDKIPRDTLCYRGSKKSIQLKKNVPTYFALEIGNANQYLPVTKKGFLGIFRTIRPILLLRLDDLDNVNKILYRTFTSNISVYKYIKSMFLPPLLPFYPNTYKKVILREESEDQPIQFKRLLRYSLCKNDFAFTTWLCSQGFNGYSAGVMDMLDFMGTITKSFPEEIVLCDPTSFLVHIKTITIKRLKNRDALQDLFRDD